MYRCSNGSASCRERWRARKHFKMRMRRISGIPSCSRWGETQGHRFRSLVIFLVFGKRKNWREKGWWNPYQGEWRRLRDVPGRSAACDYAWKIEGVDGNYALSERVINEAIDTVRGLWCLLRACSQMHEHHHFVSKHKTRFFEERGDHYCDGPSWWRMEWKCCESE